MDLPHQEKAHAFIYKELIPLSKGVHQIPFPFPDGC